MPLENLVGPNIFITNLVRSNPLGTDPESEGDDHLRGIKNAVLNSFPNINAIVTATPAQLNGAISANSPALTGTPTAPTAAPGTNNTQIANAAFVAAAIAASVSASATGNGWLRVGPILIQWGNSNPIGDDASLVVPFPVAFTTCFTVVACGSYFTTGTTFSSLNVTTFNQNNFTLGHLTNGPTTTVGRWVAVGV